MMSPRILRILFFVTIPSTLAQTNNVLERRRGRIRGNRQVASRKRPRALPNSRVRQEVLDQIRQLSVGNNGGDSLDEPARDSRKEEKKDKRSKEGGPPKGGAIPKKQKSRTHSEKGGKKSRVKGQGNGGQSSVVPSFNLADCDSYSNDWLFELAGTCDGVGDELTNCQCTTAGRLLDSGVLTCATVDQRFMSPPACPHRCPVCELCMVLIGCDDIYDQATL